MQEHNPPLSATLKHTNYGVLFVWDKTLMQGDLNREPANLVCVFAKRKNSTVYCFAGMVATERKSPSLRHNKGTPLGVLFLCTERL